MDRTHRKKLLVWLIAVFAVSLLGTASAVASPQPFEVHEYERDFGVSQSIAERNLETQEHGAGLVGELKAALGKSYAGVWFDNKTGEFVVPLLPSAPKASITSVLVDDELGRDFRTMSAESSWEELEAAQDTLNKSLDSQIRNRLVQTSLEPRTNAVLVRETEAVGKADQAEFRRLVANQEARSEITSESVQRFNFKPLACKTSAPRACGRPLRGGVSLTRNTKAFHPVGECSVGFKATVNGNRFVLTAGHCAAAFSSWGSEDANENFHPIGGVAAYKFPGGDWAKISANGSEYWDWNPWPSEVAHFWEDQERTINSEAWSYLGQYVCHSGTQSGTSCGGVSALEVTAPYGVSHLTEVKGVCAIGGDSGGPIFAGNTALGLLSGGDLEFPECERPILYAEITEATSAMGVSVGTRLGGAPTATTNSATNLQATQATANGEVNPNSVETHYRFEYGTTTAYGSSLPVPDGNVGHGTGTVGVNVTLQSLKPSTTYHYRVVATSAAGTSFGGDQQFATPAMPTYITNVSSDVSGDGKADLLGREANGTVKVYESAGYGFKEPTSWGGFASVLTPMYVADVSGDGKADLLGRESNGTVKVYLSSGTGFKEPTSWGGFASVLTPMYVAGPAQ